MDGMIEGIKLPDVSSATALIGQILLLGALLLGTVLWVMGRKMARPGCALTGLVLSGLGVLTVAPSLGGGELTLVWIIGGSVMGCVLAWLLYRVWMGISTGLLLALAVPAASVIWEGPAVEPDQPVFNEVTESVNVMSESLEALIERKTGLLRTWTGLLRTWWEQLGPNARRVIVVGAAIGAAVGLAGGLLVPNAAAAFQSSLVGSLLILAAAKGLVMSYSPQYVGFLPQQLRSSLLLIGLITVGGIIIQWTLWSPKTDK